MNVPGRGRARSSGEIGTGPGDWPAGRADQGKGDVAAGHSQGDGIPPGARASGNRAPRPLREDERERAGPERRGQRLGPPVEAREIPGRIELRDMDDQRIGRGPALGRVDGGDRVIVRGVRPQAVHRLGGERDDLPIPKASGRPRDGLRRCRHNAGPVRSLQPVSSHRPNPVSVSLPRAGSHAICI